MKNTFTGKKYRLKKVTTLSFSVTPLTVNFEKKNTNNGPNVL